MLPIDQHYQTFEEMAHIAGTSLEFEITSLLIRMKVKAKTSEEQRFVRELTPRFNALAKLARSKATAAGISDEEQNKAILDGLSRSAATDRQREMVAELAPLLR